LLGFLILIIFSVLAVQLKYFDLNPASQREYLVWDDPRTVAWDKKLVAEEYILTSAGSEGSLKPLRMTTVPQWNPMILYESNNGKSLLEKSNLLIIYNTEKDIKDLENWPNICKAKSISDTGCGQDAYNSPLAFLALDGQFKAVADLTQEEIDTAWENVFNDPSKFGKIAKLIQKKESI